MIDFKEEHHDKLRQFSPLLIQNGVINLNSEHPSSADHFEIKFQAKISPSEKSLENPEEELIPITKYDRDKLQSNLDKHIYEMKSMNEHIADMLVKLYDEYDKEIEKQIQPMLFQITDISSKQSENIQNKVLTMNSENPFSEYNFDRKFQDNISPYNQIF